MSKNFELMQEEQARVERHTSSVAPPAPILLPNPVVVAASQHVPGNFDRMGQEECLKLVQRLFLGQPATAPRVVIFAGIDPGVGCSRICIEAAPVLAANTSGSVCAVDGNFRKPSLANFLGLPGERGLADSMLANGSIQSFIQQVPSSKLSFLSAGDVTSSSPSLLTSERLKGRIDELRSEFDYVLIDSPALNAYSDAIAFGRMADGLVLVLGADSTRRETAMSSLKELRDAHIEVLGAVLNRRTFPIPDFVYRRL